MKTKTKRSLLQAATATAVVCAAALVFMPAIASAAPAVATSTVNVRSGPSTSYRVIDTLRPGELVDVGGCRSGWCYLTDERGFVSSSYLRRGSSSGAVIEPNFNLSFNFPQGSISIGTGGVSIGVGPGRPDRPEPPRPPSGSLPGDVCFYSGTDFTGQRFCMDEGDRTAYVGRAWDDRISSIRNPGELDVTVCKEPGYDLCRTYRTSARALGTFDDEISSIRVR